MLTRLLTRVRNEPLSIVVIIEALLALNASFGWLEFTADQQTAILGLIAVTLAWVRGKVAGPVTLREMTDAEQVFRAADGGKR